MMFQIKPSNMPPEPKIRLPPVVLHPRSNDDTMYSGPLSSVVLRLHARWIVRCRHIPSWDLHPKLVARQSGCSQPAAFHVDLVDL